MSAVARRAAAALVAAFVFLGALLVAGAPSHADDLPVVPPGCVLTGGGVACGAGSGINDPVEQPAEVPADPEESAPAEEDAAEDTGPVEVTTVPPAPVFHDPCGPDNVAVSLPAGAEPWLYSIHADEVGGSGYVQAYLPEGFVIGPGEQAGDRYWDPVFEWRDSHTPCPADAPAPAPGAPGTPEQGGTVVPDELATTGPEDVILPAVAGILLLGVGGLLLYRRRVA